MRSQEPKKSNGGKGANISGSQDWGGGAVSGWA